MRHYLNEEFKIKIKETKLLKDFLECNLNDIKTEFGETKKRLIEIDENIRTNIKGQNNLLFIGNTGSGKTMISSILLKNYLGYNNFNNNHKGFYLNTISYIDKNRKEYELNFNKIKESEFIILDNIGIANKDSFIWDKNMELLLKICEYMENKLFIVNTIKTIEELTENEYPKLFLNKIKSFEIIEFPNVSFRSTELSKYEKLQLEEGGKHEEV